MPNDKGPKTPINPDPAFYRMLTTYLKEANKHVGRIQALGATVYVAKPGDNITQCLYIAEDGVNTLVKDKEDVEIPDLEVFIIRLEEMCKVSAEQAVDLVSKAAQIKSSPAFKEIMLFIPYYMKAFKEMATVLTQLHKVLGEVDAMDVQKQPTEKKIQIPSSDSEDGDAEVPCKYIEDQVESDGLSDDMPPTKKAKKASTKRPPAKKPERKPAEKKKAERKPSDKHAKEPAERKQKLTDSAARKHARVEDSSSDDELMQIKAKTQKRALDLKPPPAQKSVGCKGLATKGDEATRKTLGLKDGLLTHVKPKGKEPKAVIESSDSSEDDSSDDEFPVFASNTKPAPCKQDTKPIFLPVKIQEPATAGDIESIDDSEDERVGTTNGPKTTQDLGEGVKPMCEG